MTLFSISFFLPIRLNKKEEKKQHKSELQQK